MNKIDEINGKIEKKIILGSIRVNLQAEKE
jgi:hypothetical protein